MAALTSAMARIALLLVVLFWPIGSARAATRPFSLHRDTFAFSNDTVLKYGVDEAGALHIGLRDKPVEFGHRCFVLTRGVLQFQKFARFAPGEPKLTREEYRVRLRRLFRIPPWSSGPRTPIVFPGFADLHTFSTAYEGLLKENLGNWFPTYCRVGNWRMLMGHPRSGQARTAEWLEQRVAGGQLSALYLARFPHMNHVVIVYAMERRADGHTRFQVYDPNYPNEPSWIEYVPGERSFNFQKRWYFPGGRVNVMRVYLSPIH